MANIAEMVQLKTYLRSHHVKVISLSLTRGIYYLTAVLGTTLPTVIVLELQCDLLTRNTVNNIPPLKYILKINENYQTINHSCIFSNQLRTHITLHLH